MTAAVERAVRPAAIDVESGAPGAAWDRYVAAQPSASVYHLGAWAGLAARVFGLDTRYLTAREGHTIVGVLPMVLFNSPFFGRFATSMPFVNYGGVVADTREAGEALVAAAVEEAKAAGASYLELRHSQRRFEHLQAQTHKVSMVLGLQPTVDDQWRLLDRKLRNQVRKAEKSGLTVTTGGADLIDPFYDVLAHNMRDLGSPVHSRRFFKDVLETFPEQSRVFCVSHEAKPVAASLVLWHGHQVEVPWASAIRRYNSLCPNVLLYWEMLKFGVERQFARFDFGRSTPHEGTYLFKQQWGAEPQPLHWEYWLNDGATIPDRSPKNPKFGRAISVWQRLPVAVTRAVGPLIVRHIP